jgi:cysteine desulfurase family protein
MLNKRIYFDNAATSIRKSQAVADAMAEVLTSGRYGNPGRAGHEESLESYRLTMTTRDAIKSFLNVPENFEVVFTKSATESLNLVIKGLLRPGDHVITTDLEHNSVLRPIYELEKDGVTRDILPIDKNGELQVDKLESLIRPNTKMIVVTHASNVLGNVVDIKKIGEFCRKHHLLFVVDATQTVGAYPIDLSKVQCDAICFSGHKSLEGPTGIGVLVAKSDLQIRPLLTGGSGIETFSHSQPSGLPDELEAGTLNIVGIAGLNAAIQEINKIGVYNIVEKISDLRNFCIAELEKIPEVTIYGAKNNEHTGVIAFNFANVDSQVLATILSEEYGIDVRGGYHCAPLVHESLTTKETGMVRVSFSKDNTRKEVETLISALKELRKTVN